ncbi:MAG: hypothetical protein ACR2N2_13025 [Acidimicrobiia bacterium]
MIELLLPRTDAGVAVQLVLWLVLTAVAVVLLRHHRDWRLLVIGVSLFGLGLMAVRAIH